MVKQKLRLGTVAFSPKGRWNAETEYKRLNVVHFLSSSYYAKKENVGQTPTLDSEYWGLLVEGGNMVVNNPDEEDITTEVVNNEHVLKLADKEYRPENYSGKGYKRLRKNIQEINLAVTKITVNSAPTKDGEISVTINNIDTRISLVKDTHNTPAIVAQTISDALVSAHTDYNIEVTENIITLTRKHSGEVASSAFDVADTGVTLVIEDSTKSAKRNILTPAMINQPNTIYVIRYDFNLGEDITIPKNCVLEFDGGSINGAYIVTGNNTSIQAGLIKIFNTDVILTGTWTVNDAYPEWFGIVANDNNADLSLAMPQLNSFNAKIHFGKGIYNTKNPVKLIDVEGVSQKDTIISMKKSGTSLYTAYVGDITVPNSSSARENWFLRNLAIVIDAPTKQDDIISSCALLIGNSGISNIENCLITTYYYNIKATDTFTEQQRIEAAKNDDKALENSANSGVRFKGYVDGLVVKDTTFGGQIGIYQEENSTLDTDTFINCNTIGSPRGYAGIIFNGSISSITFQQLSISKAMFGIKAYHNFNGITINGGRSEQSIVLKDPDDNKVLGGFLYVNKTDNDVISATILSYYMDYAVNGIYLKNGSGRINVGIYNLYNRGNYGIDLKYALYASSNNLSSIINTRNATFQNAPVTLDGMMISECNYADISISKYILISNCIIRSNEYKSCTEFKNYKYDGDRLFAPFITEGRGAIQIRLTKRLKDVSGFTCCRLNGIANIYNSKSFNGYVKSIDFDILVDKNGNIIKEEKINDTENNMSVSVDTSTCIVTLTLTGLTDIIGECIFYKSTYA